VEARSVRFCRFFAWWGDCVVLRGPVGDAASSGLVARSRPRAWAAARPGGAAAPAPCQPPRCAGARTPARRPAAAGRKGGRFRRCRPLLCRGICPSEPPNRLHTAVAPGAPAAAGTRGRRASARAQGRAGRPAATPRTRAPDVASGRSEATSPACSVSGSSRPAQHSTSGWWDFDRRTSRARRGAPRPD
jgi:hypothetical protein